MMKIDLKKYRETQYPTLDPTTPWFEFLSYCECCASLDVKDQPKIGRFIKYRNYLKEIGIL